MTHSHANTMLSKMGFNDDDNGDSIHDLACSYVCSRDISLAIARKIVEVKPGVIESGYRKYITAIEIKCCEQEVCLTKGDGKYRTMIGFIDAVIRMEAVFLDGNDKWRSRFNVGIEVKKSGSSGDILRQMNLYREFCTGTLCVVFVGPTGGRDSVLEKNGYPCFSVSEDKVKEFSLIKPDSVAFEL